MQPCRVSVISVVAGVVVVVVVGMICLAVTVDSVRVVKRGGELQAALTGASMSGISSTSKPKDYQKWLTTNGGFTWLECHSN